MKKPQIYKCIHCNSMILKLNDVNVTPSCCNETMQLVTPNSSDGAGEKHVPHILNHDKKCNISGSKIAEVQIGSVMHPMTNEHHIEWIGSFDDDAWVIKWVKLNEQPKKMIRLNEDTELYEHCNLHGLWKK